MMHADVTQYTIIILMILSNSQVHDISELEKKAKTWQNYVASYL